MAFQINRLLPIGPLLPPLADLNLKLNPSFKKGSIYKSLELKVNEPKLLKLDILKPSFENKNQVIKPIFIFDNELPELDKIENPIEKLKSLKPSELKELGQRQDKKAFFEALLPAALETERIYGVPATVTLAQAALESAWARKPIGGYNIFGITGKGPTGESVRVKTREHLKGKDVHMYRNFAKFHNFHEAVVEHGKLFTRHPKFVAAVEQFKKDGDDLNFLKNISKTYATDPHYEWAIKKE